MQHFQELGYFKEYYIGSKFIGFIESEKDREQIGFWGKKQEQTTEDIILQNKKKIKSGQIVFTILYPLNGKSL